MRTALSRALFFWFVVYLLKHLQLPGAEGLPEAGSGPRSRSVFTLCLPISALTSQHGCSGCARERGARALHPPPGEEGTRGPGRGRAPEPGAPLACTALPGLSFLCKLEQIK